MVGEFSGLKLSLVVVFSQCWEREGGGGGGVGGRERKICLVAGVCRSLSSSGQVAASVEVLLRSGQQLGCEVWFARATEAPRDLNGEIFPACIKAAGN